ncbi:restriction endonuclease subunit S [Nostocoides vanveenii]|uniref:restriction endonuclease subunit S n=1 Tax=Nostocoides vanveenii TaxID=330835 RepID=UPI0031DF5B61
MIATTSEDDAAVGKATAWLGAEPAAVSGDAHIFHHTLDPKFVSYFFQTTDFQRQKQTHLTGAKVRRISADGLSRIRIPLPPLEIQREIVEVLDTFRSLEAELEAELEARRAQYRFYAESLLKPDPSAARATFGSLATVVRGASPRPIHAFLTDAPDGVPWIKIGDVPVNGKYVAGTAERVTPGGASKSRRVFPGDFVLSNSMSFGRPYISAIEGCIHDGWLAISDFQERFEPDYLYYLLRSEAIQSEFERRAGSGTVRNLNAEIVRSIEVPLVPREEQLRVIELLDRFDALVNDLSMGLPAELAARRTQYEYYRDKLLTFPEAS